MRLTTRLVTFLVLTLAVLVSTDGYLEYQRERELIEQGMSRDARVLGLALGAILPDVWTSQGLARARSVISEVNSHESDISVRWVSFRGRPQQSERPRVELEALGPSIDTGRLHVVETEGGTDLCAYFRVPGPEGDAGLEVVQPGGALTEGTTRVFRRSATQLFLLFLAAALTVYGIGIRLVGRPLSALMAKVDEIGRGELDRPLNLPGSSELAQLGVGLNRMCDRLRESQVEIRAQTDARIAAVDQARHADRLRTVGRLASGVAHELGTPLNVVGGRAALIAGGKLDSAGVVDSAKIIQEQADRMTQIIRQLLVFARRSPPGDQRVSATLAVGQALSILAAEARKAGVELRVDHSVGESCRVACGAAPLQQLTTNLILNAIQAQPDGGLVEVRVSSFVGRRPSVEPGPESSFVRFEVEDAGEGIPDDVLERLFEPFYTTKDVGQGTGLGLSIVHGILTDHGGWIEVRNLPRGGACFTFYLPEAPR